MENNNLIKLTMKLEINKWKNNKKADYYNMLLIILTILTVKKNKN